MAYSKEKMRELARIQLSRLTRKSLGQLQIDAIMTIALDTYARETLAFEQESTFNTAEDTSTYTLTTIAVGFLSPVGSHALRVGTDFLAKHEIVPIEMLEDLQDQNPGSSRGWAMIDDANGTLEIYPTPSGIEAARFRNSYVPILPTTDAGNFPEPLELRGFMHCIRAALFEFEDQFERAEALIQLFRDNYVPDIKKRLKLRRKPSGVTTRFRNTG